MAELTVTRVIQPVEVTRNEQIVSVTREIREYEVNNNITQMVIARQIYGVQGLQGIQGPVGPQGPPGEDADIPEEFIDPPDFSVIFENAIA